MVTVNGRSLNGGNGRFEWRDHLLRVATELRASTAILVTENGDRD